MKQKTRTNQPVEPVIELEQENIDALKEFTYNEDDNVELATGLEVGGDLEATGDAKIFENIVDNQGHNRFADYPMTIYENAGVSGVYLNASLSGTHLLMVAVLNIEDTSVLNDNINLVKITIPEWVGNKVYPIIGAVVTYGENKAYASNYSSQVVSWRLQKSSSTALVIVKEGAMTLTATRQVRIAIDLLIDNN